AAPAMLTRRHLAERHRDSAEFIDRAGGLLARDPVRNTVICSVAEAVAGQPDLFPGALWITVSHGEHVVGAAMCTLPYPVALTPMPDPALDALADLIVAEFTGRRRGDRAAAVPRPAGGALAGPD